MSPCVRITDINDTKKLVDSWIKIGARVTRISEDTEDHILWMTLESRLGRLQLRRNSCPLNLDTPTTGVWNTLDKVPGSPYSVEDNCWGRESALDVRAQYDRLWRKYFDPNWKRLDFLLGKRENETHDGGLGEALMLLSGCLLALGFLGAFVLLAGWLFR